MKRMTIESLAEHVDDLVAAARKDRVLLTKAGKPFAFVSDASNYDEEDIGYMTDPEFWRMIAARRREGRGGVPLQQVIERIDREERKLKVKSKPRPASRGKNKGKRNGTA